MGVLSDLGVSANIPSINITGFFSSTWVYIAFIVLVGIILIAGICILLFFLTYKKKIVIFENISGQGYQPILKTRARVLKLGIGGEEILKTLIGGIFISAYGRKMGKNTYWYAKGQDGYLYNIVLGDLDAKQALLDIEPIDRDVRMFHVALDRLSHQTYGKQNFMEKYGIHIMLFIFLVTLILGLWFIIGKIGEAVEPLAQSAELSLKIQESNAIIQESNAILISKLESIVNNLGGGGCSGLVPVT